MTYNWSKEPDENVYEYRIVGSDAEDHRTRMNPSSSFTWEPFDPDELAQEAGEWEFHNCDGYELSWPQKIEVWKNGERLGLFSVEVEAVPQFSAIHLCESCDHGKHEGKCPRKNWTHKGSTACECLGVAA